jgi:hypothetical protein
MKSFGTNRFSRKSFCNHKKFEKNVYRNFWCKPVFEEMLLQPQKIFDKNFWCLPQFEEMILQPYKIATKQFFINIFGANLFSSK